jgi:magnesium chelatase family protein
VLATARTFTLLGIDAREVRVEVDVPGNGLPTFSLVGLPDAAVRESRERVRSALENAGFDFPQSRITANLAPADLRKAGPGLDLAIAAALLGAMGKLSAEVLDRVALAGELALDGSIRSVPGVLAITEAAARSGMDAIAVPAENAAEASLAGAPRVIPLRCLQQLPALGGEDEPAPPEPGELAAFSSNGAGSASDHPDLADLRGQAFLRRALEIAAAGGHSLLITGPPGSGKSLAARRLPSLLPPLRRPEALEVLRIASACGRPARLGARPFRAPHHTISAAGLVGGGSPPRAGEITLAHRGVLFLDELAEFSRDALEALRQPVEDGRVLITRARHAIELPSRFMLIGAANPCPCGHGEDSSRCKCGQATIRRYRARLSGALADRMDITVRVSRPTAAEMSEAPGESSAQVRERVIAARERQDRRLGEGRSNAEMTAGGTRRQARLTGEARRILLSGHDSLGLSGRGHDRVLRVARTIADLEGADRVDGDHVGEALTLRRRNER